MYTEDCHAVVHGVVKSQTQLSNLTELNCVSDSFIDYDGYFICFKAFFPRVVDIMVI